MKIVLFTRTAFHHTYFINRLQERFDISYVVRESYPDKTGATLCGMVRKNLLRRAFFARMRDDLFLRDFHRNYSAGFTRHKILAEYLKTPFDAATEKGGTQYLNVKCGELNSAEFSKWLGGLRPEIIAVLGSSILKPHVLSVPSVGIINLHSGLSPYYRGTWSYGWPLVNREPEYIGATVHHVSGGLDSGDILHQTRPLLSESDDLNSIFLKVIVEGVELVADSIEEMRAGGAERYRQPENAGRLYLTKDFNAAAGRAALFNLQNGIVTKYLSSRDAADSAVALWGYLPPRIFR